MYKKRRKLKRLRLEKRDIAFIVTEPKQENAYDKIRRCLNIYVYIFLRYWKSNFTTTPSHDPPLVMSVGGLVGLSVVIS